MNRLQSQSDPQTCEFLPSSAAVVEPYSIEFGWYAASEDEPLSLLAPQHYEPNYKYPLLIWLHGAGGDERQLLKIMPHVSLRNYVAAAPRGVVPMSVRGVRCYDWRQDEENYALSEQRILSAIQAARARYSVHSDRVFIGGFQSGGTMAYRFACDHPAELAGVLSIGGAFPADCRSLRRWHDLRRLPMYAAYCTDSVCYPPAAVGEDLRLFHAAKIGMYLEQYPGDDSLCRNMLANLDRWMMAIVTGAASDLC